MGHGILMGVLSIVAGTMLTLAVAAYDTSEYAATTQAALPTQQSETAQVDTNESETIRVVVRFHDQTTSNDKSHSYSRYKAYQTEHNPEL